MTRKIRRTWHRKTAALAATMMAMSFGGMAYAMPQGETIRSGHGEITRQDKEMTVNQDTKHLAIDWKGFDINNDERVRFNQPDAASIALNRVTGDAKTFIDGSLTANGQVFVINPNGVLFGQNASVDVGSLVASTARVSDSQMEAFGNGDGTLNLELADDSTAKVINEGTIRAEGGLVALHAAAVENSGTIANEGGKIALAAAKNINLSADTAGKLNFTVDGTLAKASTLNSGVLKADGGYIVMTAKQAGDVMSTVVNNTGTIEAKTLRQNEKGEILLDGGESGIVEISGTIDASGMEAGQSAGQIKAIGAETYVKDGAALLARGTVDGGLIETSGDYLEIGDTVNIDAAGETGKAGEWLLDPLDVVISDSKPSGSTNAASDGSYNEVQTEDANKTSWVNSTTVNNLLSSGTSVKIQAVDKNKAAAITVDSEIKKSGAANKDTTFTLEAQSNVTVNKSITSTAGKLNVILNSDIDGNGVGAVLINADIDTNGGSFTSGSGGNVELESYTWGGKTYYRVAGTADPTKGTVGTYFGNGGSTAGRTINTNGGAVNLYGDVAVGLNGGNLTLDTNGGAVKVIGSIDSGNAYTIYSMDDTAKWDELVNKIKSSYSNYAWNSKVKSYYESISSQNKIAQSGEGYSYYDFQGNLRYYIVDWSNLSASEKEKVAKYYVANNWDFAKILAQGNTEGGAKTGDTYLATITTALENSLTSQGKENPLFVGGRGSGNSRNPVDNTYRDGYYWITGPEGLVTNANGTKGTKFARNDGTPTENYYANWNNGKSNITGETTKEPNNSGPYVSVGFGTASNWDDVKSSAGTTKGFVQEKNLAHSGLVINSNGGSVDLKGNVGHSVALSKLAITSTGTVNIGGGTNQSGATLSGIVHVDNNVDITGNGVTVGDRITSDAGHVNVTSDGNILVHGITAADKIKLVSTGESGDITIDDYGTTNNGALITKSTANDAVIIDARGTDGSFHNATDATKAANAITTGTGGNWQVYSASPDRDTFGKNLNSYTTARWHASSTGGNGLYTYAKTENTNKYIFQVQPTLTVTADNKTKVYGETVDLTAQEKAEFIGKDGNPHDVTGYTDAFQEVSEGGSIMDRYSGSYKLSSAGQAASATRTNGDRQADDKKLAIYDINVENQSLHGLEGYGVATLNKGELKITRRTVVLNGSASQTYGDATLKNKNVYAETGTAGQGLTNGDELNKDAVEYTISDSGNYEASKNAHVNGVTADAGTYNDELLFSNVHFTNNADANYTVTGNGDITVDPYTIKKDDLVINGKPLYTTVYGTKKDLGTAKFAGVNGDAAMDLAITATDALTGNDTGRLTNDFGDHYYTVVTLNDAQSKNYRFEGGETSKQFNDTASVTQAKLTITTNDLGNVEYGNVDTIKNGLINAGSLDGLVNGDDENIVSTVNGTTDALIDGGRHTNNVKDGGYTIAADLSSLSDKSLDTLNKNYEITRKEGKVNLTRKRIELITNDIPTTYGDGNTILAQLNNNLLHLKGLVNDDDQSTILDELGAHITVENNKSAFKQNPDGTIMTDAVTGQHYTSDAGSYSITTGAYLAAGTTNYEVVAGENAAGHTVGKIYVEKAPLTVNRTGYETTYGTVITDDAAHRFTTWSGLVNGDVDDIYINYGNYGGAYKDNNTRTNNAGTYKFYKGLQSDKDVLRNYDVTDTGKNWVTIKPYELTDADILNATYTTKYGSAYSFKKFGTAKLKNINGDGELNLRVVGSNALTGKTKGRVTEDVGQNIYNTVVSLDAIYGADGFDLKNYTLNGKALDKNDRMTIANSASVTPADLTVKVGNVWTNYGEAFDPDEYDYSIQKPANGDDAAALKSELGKLDYVNKGVGTDGRATQDVGHYALEGTADQKLSNYTIHFENGDAEVKPLDVQNNLKEYFTNATYTTKYGERAEFGNATFKDVNGNGEKTLKIIGSSALTGELTGRVTKSFGDNYNTVVSLEGFTAQDLINYGLTGLTQLTFNDSASVTKADLTVKVGNVWTTYGTPFNKDAYDYSVTNPTNDDSADELKAAIGDLDYTNNGIGENGKATKDVGHYDLLGATNSVLNNYNIHVEKGDAEVRPYTITEDDIVNLDGSPLYTTKYGQKDAFGTAIFTGVNGDGMYELAITDSSALTGASEGQVTYDAGDKVYNTTIKLSDAMNGNYQFAGGAKSATFDNTASVTPAELKLTTDDIVTEYGTIKLANTKVEGLTNGDEMPDAGFIFDYGEYNDYGGAYLNNNTKTNNVKQRADGTFEAYDPFETTIKLESRPDFLNNYTITSNKATATITPKDVTFFVTGTGKTTSDVTYTENPLVDSQLAYGERVNTLYTLDQDLGNNQYSILTYIDGQKVTTGDVIGNYRFNYEGLATITPDEPNPPTKPDIDHNNPSNIDGTASWTNSMGNHGIPGVDRVAGLASAELPFFKVQNGEVSQYGTYSVATDPDKVTLEATGKRLPEPNQPKTQYREYTKELTTAAGTGTFRMIYDGSTFRIKPVGMMAKNVIASGDATQNVELYAQALHAGFNEMGILLEDLDGVYVHFDENK